MRKHAKRLGIAAFVLAAVVLLAGVAALLLRGEVGPFASMMADANAVQEAQQTRQAQIKAAEGAKRKADAAVSGAEKALEAAREAAEALEGIARQTEEGALVLHAQAAGAQEGMAGTLLLLDALEEMISPVLGEGGTLLQMLADIRQTAQGAQADVRQVESGTRALLGQALAAVLMPAQESLENAREAQVDARAAVNGVLLAGQAALAEGQPFPFAVEPAGTLVGDAQVQAVSLQKEAEWLLRLAQEDQEAAAMSLSEQSGRFIAATQKDRIVRWLATYYIALWFTGLLLIAVGIVCFFFSEQFLHQWKKNPVFSTFIALLVMLVIQTYSMRFTYPTFGEWGRFWLDNAFNVLRANTSVGIIALGMTMVVITGGIDLAVGSTLAGVGTVVMVLIDTSSRGLLGQLGVTGVPAYALGILGGFAAGALIGALIGLGVTKGRVPPFIITLGIMNIVRSLAQFFTKSYTPKVPSDFTAIANTVIFGQRLLPILYWLVLAVFMYLMMERTRFGRHIYAVGSNERTTRLSGINTDWVKFRVYTLMGLLVSVASVTQVSRLGGMDVASAGSGYELDAIAAVVVGGTSMSGGRGSILGTVIGVLIIGVMNNLLILLGVDSFLTNAFKGAIVVAAVLMQRKEKTA